MPVQCGKVFDNIGVSNSYRGLGLHERCHGETFFTVLEQKFQCNGLFLLDEPEAALSPQRQLAFLSLAARHFAQTQKRPIHRFQPFALAAGVSRSPNLIL
jgi:predicted ATPase